MHEVAAFLASIVFVGLKSFQQLNVAYDRWYWVLPTSLAMAVCEVAVVVIVAKHGHWLLWLPIGLGSGIGCLVAMCLHRRMRK